MTKGKKLLPVAAGAVLAGALAVTVAVTTLGGRPAPRPVASPPAPPRPAQTSYAQAVDAAHQRGLRVWIEADLVKRWHAGPASFRDAVATIATLATRPGVVGIKTADEIGYHDGLDTPDQVGAFLHATATALRAAAPGKQLLVDILVPELGCLPDHTPPLRWATICQVQARGQYPQLALDAVDGYLRSGDVDVIDLSTGLLTDRTYSGWGVDMDTAQRTAWQEVHRRGWDRWVRLQARKALAHPGRYTDDTTEATLATYVDIPRSQGAAAVDVWTWRQQYQGQLYRLMDPGLRQNALWDALAARRGGGADLFTHLSPHSLEVGLDTDLDVLARVFSDLFVAAGTG